MGGASSVSAVPVINSEMETINRQTPTLQLIDQSKPFIPLVQSPSNRHIYNKDPSSYRISIKVDEDEFGHSYPPRRPNNSISFRVISGPMSPICFASFYGFGAMVQRLISNGEANIDEVDLNGCTPLYIACFKGHANVAKILAEHCIDINIGKPPFSPLYAASRMGHSEIVDFLVARKANLYLSDFDQNTAYDVAASDEIRSSLLCACESYGRGLCAICWVQPVHPTTTFSPCDHNILCRSCHFIMREKEIFRCPMCRSEIWSL